MGALEARGRAPCVGAMENGPWDGPWMGPDPEVG